SRHVRTDEIYTLSLHDALPISKTRERLRTRGGENVARKNGAEVIDFPAEDGRTSATEEKAKKIKTELTRLKKVFKDLPEDKRRIDRKSTRLNSSHVKISYAVFC